MTQTFVLAPGTSISHYEVLSRLGAGGMGEVYRARDLTLERDIALKVLSPEFLTSVERVRRFVQEARSASALNHPHIVTIYEIGQVVVPAASIAAPGTEASGDLTIHFIAMELIEGITLRAMIHKGAELRRMLDVMSQVSDGLAKAHGSGIVHRDLKPDNIMITVDGYAKIVDFGLAKLTEKTRQKGQELTEEGVVMGTAAYMSPEQVQGLEIDQRSDIFSMGSILYEVVTGRRPFASDSSIDTMHRIVFAHPQPIFTIVTDVPADLQRILDKCLAKNPDERYQSTKDLAVDLRAAARSLDLPRVSSGPNPMFAAGGVAASPPQGVVYGVRTPSGGAPAVAPVPSPAAGVSAAAPAPPVSAPAPALTTPIVEEERAPTRRARSESTTVGFVAIVYRTLLAVVLVVAAYLWYTWPDFSKVKGRLTSTPMIELQRDRIAKAGGGAEPLQWKWVSYDEISPSLRRAAIEAVDPAFLTESMTFGDAFDGLMRAVKRKERPKFQGRIPGSSEISRGAVKDAMLSPSNPVRGIQAMGFAVGLEHSLSRREILELYLNTAPVSDNVFGVEAAAQKFFGKPARSLTLQQSALLALKLADPSGIDVQNPDAAAVARQNAIVEALRQGTKEEPAPAPAAKKGSREKNGDKDTTAPAKPEQQAPATEEAPPPASEQSTAPPAETGTQ